MSLLTEKEQRAMPRRCTECGDERPTTKGFNLFRKGGLPVCTSCWPKKPPTYTWSDNPSLCHV